MSYQDCFCTERAIIAGCPIHDAILSAPCHDGDHDTCPGVIWTYRNGMAEKLVDWCKCPCNCRDRYAEATA